MGGSTGPMILALIGVVAVAGLAIAVFGRGLGRRTRDRSSEGVGWSLLAARFRMERAPESARRFTRETVQVGDVLVRRCAEVGLSAAGLSLQAPWRTALLIPWSEIRGALETEVDWQRAVRLRVGETDETAIAVRWDVFRAICPFVAEPAIPHAEPVEAPVEELVEV